MTGLLRRTAAAAGIAGILVPLCAVPALAAEDPETGYWSRTRLGLLPVEPPDRVPEGGSFVAQDPAGPVAVSALRGDADPGNVIVGLRLPIADALGTPAVQACPTTENWVPVQGGRLEAAPAADCTAPIDARVEEDTLVVDLPPELQLDLVDVLLRPREGSAFSLTLERATAESLVQAPVAPAGQPAQAAGPAVAPPPPATSGFPPAGSGFDSGSDATIPDFPAPETAADPLLAAPTLPEPAAAAPVPQPQAAAPAPVVLATRRPPVAPDDRTTALLATALLAGLGALAVRLAVQPAAAPQRLGGAARLTRGEAAPAPVVDSPARGVGRFRAARVRPPVRI